MIYSVQQRIQVNLIPLSIYEGLLHPFLNAFISALAKLALVMHSKGTREYVKHQKMIKECPSTRLLKRIVSAQLKKATISL